MENEKPQTQTEQILNSIGGRRGRRGRNLPIGKVTFVSGGHGGLPLLRPQRPQSPNQPAFFAQICRFMFSDGFEVSELVALLVAWAETNHPEAYRHLELSLMNGPEVRRTLGAMYRRMAKDESMPLTESLPNEPDQDQTISPRRWCDALAEAVTNDPTGFDWLKVYIERDERGMWATDQLDAGYRGQRDELDKRVTERCIDEKTNQGCR